MELEISPLEFQQEPAPDQETQTSQSVESVATGFLKNIPEQDRPIVEKHVKDWDANVTKKFQSIHDSYKPYKDLGEIEDLQRAQEMFQRLQDDPVEFLNLLQQALNEINGDNEVEIDDQNDEIDPNEGTGDPRDAELADLRSQLEQFQSQYQQNETTRQEQEAMQQLDNVIKDLHNTFGKFDDTSVLVKISQGMEPQKAVEAWFEDMKQYGVNSQPKNFPKTITGAGSHPGGQVDPSKMTAAERIKYTTQMLAAATQD